MLNILVGQGIIGFVIFCAFLVYSMSKYIKYYFESSEEDAFFNNIMLSCVAVATMGSMFLTGMFYSNSPAVIMFWICLGNFMGCFEKKIRDIPQNVVK